MKIGTIFMNSKNIPNSDPYRLRCTLLDLLYIEDYKKPMQKQSV